MEPLGGYAGGRADRFSAPASPAPSLEASVTWSQGCRTGCSDQPKVGQMTLALAEAEKNARNAVVRAYPPSVQNCANFRQAWRICSALKLVVTVFD